jgi:hypothetical protein
MQKKAEIDSQGGPAQTFSSIQMGDDKSTVISSMGEDKHNGKPEYLGFDNNNVVAYRWGNFYEGSYYYVFFKDDRVVAVSKRRSNESQPNNDDGTWMMINSSINTASNAAILTHSGY